MQCKAKPPLPGSLPIYPGVTLDFIVVSETTHDELVEWGVDMDDPMFRPADGQVVLRAVGTTGVDAILSPETFVALFDVIPET